VPHRRTAETGATLVETAFVYTILLFPLLLGALGFSHALYAYHFVSHASKTSTRWAAVNGYTCSNDGSCTYATGASATDIQTYATNMIPAGLEPANVTASASWPLKTGGPKICSQAVGTQPSEANYPGCTVEVQVGYAYQLLFPFLPVNSTTTAPCTKPGWCLTSTSDMVIIH
jgi:Flp pilus assembly protein TadG